MYKELIDFKNKKVVVFGAGLIGREIIKAFGEFNASVIVIDTLEENEFKSLGLDFHEYYKCDVVNKEDVNKVVESIFFKHNKIQSWVNVFYPKNKCEDASIEGAPLEWFNSETKAHLGGYFLVSQSVLKEMSSRGSGSLINFSSIYGFLGPNFSIYEGLDMKNSVAYSAIKGGVINLTRYLASFYGPMGIRVNTVSPGGVFDNQNEIFVKKYSNLTPLRRMANKEEVAMPVLFLASEASSYITGQNIIIDGGWSSH